MYFVTIVLGLLFIQKLQCVNYRANSRLNFFDTDLLHYSTENKPGNVAISPASVKSTLAMLLEGARGSTAEEIRSALRLAPDREEAREQLYLYLNALKYNSTRVRIINANAVFVYDRLELKKEFDVILRNIYFTQIFHTDFHDPISTALIVNKWVNDTTKGLIQTVADPATIDIRSNILFSNALYFKSTWKYAFDPHLTRGDCFHVHNRCQMVEMMQLQAELNYAFVDDLRAHAVELPYEGGRYSMIILVPLDHNGWTSIIRDLPYMSLPDIVELMEPNDLELAMPKFTVDFSDDMAGPLSKMKIKNLFTLTADLTGMFDCGNSQVTSILHKVYLSVDEAGTVAAAASAGVVIPLIQNGVFLKVDRPFVFFIRDNSVGLTLFEGKIEDPKEYLERPATIDIRSNILFSNALYFKSTWKYAFDPHLTRGDCFHVHNRCQMVEMMQLQAELNYAFVDDLRAHAVELPYEGGRYSMIILVPLDHNGWTSIIRDLPYMSLPDIVELMEPNDLELAMPKFTVDFSDDMAGPLSKMKIKNLFTLTADLTGMFDCGNSQVTSILHKVYLSVDEAGTVAAAASAGVVIPLIQNGVFLKVDRPFVFFIRDNSVGLTLFEGKIEDPKEYLERPATSTKHTTHKQQSFYKRIIG